MAWGWLIGVIIVGALRIAQANCNKFTSGDINTKSLHFRYGALYEGTASLLSFAYLAIVGFSGWNTGTIVCALLSSFFFVKTALIRSISSGERSIKEVILSILSSPLLAVMGSRLT